MKRHISLILVFVLLATLGTVYADADKKRPNEVIEFRVIDSSELPEGVTPLPVPKGVSLEDALQELRKGTLGHQVDVSDIIESMEISPRSLDTESVNLMVYCDCVLYDHNAYSKVTYDVITSEIQSVTNLDSDITGYTLGIGYYHNTTFNDIDYSGDYKTVTIDTGGHFTYYLITEDSQIVLYEENIVFTYSYSVQNGIFNLDRNVVN